MKQEIEIEFKMMLNKNEYDHLLRKLPFPNSAIAQTNYYFETNDFLLKQKMCALRIRVKNNTNTLTLKQPHESGILETHEKLTNEQVNDWINNKPNLSKQMKKHLKMLAIPINRLHFYGSLMTERRQFVQNNIVYVLDKSFYNNVTDFELEIEAPSKTLGKQAFHSLLDDFNIDDKKTVPKIKRFFNTLAN